ncbi:MAG: hypothetical protein Q8R28_18095 [Dehalococcoidia bacterium]|nr:hypothetical protein [Dehalococcoidia bacterium]
MTMQSGEPALNGPDDDDEVEGEDVETADVDDAEGAAGEGDGADADDADAEPPKAKSGAKPKAKAEPSAAPPPDHSQDFGALQTEHRALQQRTAQIEQELEKREDAEKVEQYRRSLAEKYGDIDMAPLVREYEGVLAEKRSARQEVKAAQVQAQLRAANQQAKVVVATRFSEEYGMPLHELMALDSPALMEAKAQLYKATHERDAERKKRVRPTRMAAPGRRGASGTKTYMDKLKSGDDLPSAAEIDRMTSRYLR